MILTARFLKTSLYNTSEILTQIVALPYPPRVHNLNLLENPIFDDASTKVPTFSYQMIFFFKVNFFFQLTPYYLPLK